MNKKIKIKSKEHLDELINDFKLLGYKYYVGPSLNVTWMLINEDSKVMRFEYGDDCYPEHKDVTEMIEDIKEPALSDLEYWKQRCLLLEAGGRAKDGEGLIDMCAKYDNFIKKHGKRE